METIKKKKSHAFGKDIYLLGVDKHGDKLWLEAASWDCNWYWGMGYVETYTNQDNPSIAKDITSHSHVDGLLKDCHHFNEVLIESVLTDKESWELADLYKSFYTLKDTAEIFHTGNSNLTTTGIDLKDKQLETHINKVVLPKIFERIYEILTPEK